MSFKKDLTDLLNKHGKDNTTNTPDYILAELLERHLIAYEIAILHKEGKME